jgi:hypothetical protein
MFEICVWRGVQDIACGAVAEVLVHPPAALSPAAGIGVVPKDSRKLGSMLDRVALPALPTLGGERVILRGFRESDIGDRLRHPIDPEEETAMARRGGASGTAGAITPEST